MNATPPGDDEPRLPAAADIEDIDLTVPDFTGADEAAVHRAVRRGVLRAGFAAASWLVLVAVVALIALTVVNNARVKDLAAVGHRAILVAHPEYAFHGMSCCGGLTDMEVTVEGTVRGEVDGSGSVTGTLRKSMTGALDLQLPDAATTPIGRALDRSPAGKAETSAFLDRLPPGVAASAILEFTTPLDRAAFGAFLAANPPETPLSTAFLTAPHSTEPLVTWDGVRDLDGYVTWARGLHGDDDEMLTSLGLPRSAALQALARDPRVHAVVLDRATPAQLRSWLANPTVGSVTLADIGFDADLVLPR